MEDGAKSGPGVVIAEITNSNPEQPVKGIQVRVDKPPATPLEGAPTEEEFDRLNALARAREARLKHNQEHSEEPQSP